MLLWSWMVMDWSEIVIKGIMCDSWPLINLHLIACRLANADLIKPTVSGWYLPLSLSAFLKYRATDCLAGKSNLPASQSIAPALRIHSAVFYGENP